MTGFEEGPKPRYEGEAEVVFTLKISSRPASDSPSPSAKKRVRWPDLEGERETCFEVGPEESSGDEEEEPPEEEETEEESSDEDEEVAEGGPAPEPSPDPPEQDEESEDEEDTNEESDEDDEEGSQEAASLKDSDLNGLYSEIAELQKNLLAKTSGMERLQNELESVYNESELARKRFRRLQDELEACKRCNRDLIDRLNTQPEGESSRMSAIQEEQLKEAEEKVKELERKLAVVKEENAKLLSALQRLEKEREEEMRMVQQALDEAAREREEAETRFGREFEKLRTVNANRELQLVEDFEWKLREVQREAKKRLEEKAKQSEAVVRETNAKLAAAEAQLEQVSHLQVCEIELKQVKAASQEQKRNLRTLTRKYEELQVSEKILQEETNRLRAALEKEKANFSAIQSLHKEDLAEKERKLQFKLEVQKNQLSAEWEERLKRDCARVKADLERGFREEKRVAVEGARQAKDFEASQAKAAFDKKIQEQLKEVTNLKRRLAEKEEQNKRDLENAQSKTDSEILELRRKMDKLDMNYQEKIEKMQEDHDRELGKLKDECEKRVQQCETNLHMQAGTTRTTLELVKQQMQKESEAKLQQMRELHHKSLERQWRELAEQKERALEELQAKHDDIVLQLRNEIASLSKRSGGSKEEVKPNKSLDSKIIKSKTDFIVGSQENKTETQNRDGQRIIDERLEGGDGSPQASAQARRNEVSQGQDHTPQRPKKQDDDEVGKTEDPQHCRNQPKPRHSHRRSRKHRRH